MTRFSFYKHCKHSRIGGRTVTDKSQLNIALRLQIKVSISNLNALTQQLYSNTSIFSLAVKFLKGKNEQQFNTAVL